ncbi:MAG: DUF4388 domain-containing protein [Myxococcales bacterium]|nr:DUF4388 domain-containing protein [Myxococcales bacterium]
MSNGILVVAPAPLGDSLAHALRAGGLGPVTVGVGDDATLEAYEHAPVHVVVLAASIEHGDAIALASAMRGLQPGVLMVVVGDEVGPFRTALDSFGFGARHFLRRPVDEAALVYCVRECLLHAAPATGRVPVVTPASPVDDGWEEVEASVSAARSAQARGEPDGDDVLDELLREVVEDAIAASAGAEESSARAVARALDAGAAPASPWREPTLILSASAAAAAVAPPAVPSVVPSAPQRKPEAPSSEATVVRDLRRTMSQIERRLFGGESQTVVAIGASAELDDLDLDRFGVDTQPGLAADLPAVGRPARPPAGATPAPTPTVAHRAHAEPRRTPAPITRKGEFAEEDAAFLVARCFRERFTGTVHFHRGDAEKTISFAEGRPVFATSNLAHDRMGDLLYREGKITREQHHESRTVVAETGRRLGEVLVELGFLKRRELLPAVRRHLEDIAYSLFGWDSGSWEARGGTGVGEEKIRLTTHPAAMVIEGVRRKLERERLQRLLGGENAIAIPRPRAEFDAGLVEVEFDPGERRVLALLDGQRSVAVLSAQAGVALETVMQLTHALLALGLVRLQVAPGASDTARERKTSPALVGGGDLAIDRERILAKHAHVVEGDYFTVLGVRRDATLFELRRAWEAGRKDYADEAFPVELQRELATPLAEIATLLDEAFRLLRDDEVRRAYLSSLTAALESSEPSAASRTEQAEPAPEEFS